MIITYLTKYGNKQANKLGNKFPYFKKKKNGEHWGIFVGKYYYAVIKDKFKGKCIE